MFGKLGVLLWKETAYRTNFPTVLIFLVPIVFAILQDLLLGLLERMNSGGETVKSIFELGEECENATSDSLFKTTLAYEPSSPITRAIMEYAACSSGVQKNDLKEKIEGNFHYGIKFNGIVSGQTDPPESLNYTIFPSGEDPFGPSTNNLWYNKPYDFTEPSKYRLKNDISNNISMAINTAFLRMKNVSDSDINGTKILIEDLNKYLPQSRVRYIKLYSSMILPYVVFLLEFYTLLPILIKEKSSGVTEFLKIMGFSKFQIRLASFICSMIIYGLVIAFSMIIMYLNEPKFTYVSPWILLAFLLLSCLAMISFCYFYHFFFKTDVKAVFFSFLILVIGIGLFFISNYLAENYLFFWLKIFLCLLPYVCASHGLFLLTEYELYGKNVDFEEKIKFKNDLNMMTYFIIIIIDILLYILLGALMENFSSTSGPNFRISRSKRSKKKNEEEQVAQETKKDFKMFEEAPKTLTPGIVIENFTKNYDAGKKGSVNALNNVNITFYEGEITGLLGHNGAGKTTLISILCGMNTATSGKIIVKGKEIEVTSTKRKKLNIGYCPQNEILLENLSVQKNLIFFGMAKDLSKKEAKAEMNELLSTLKFESSRKVRAKNLSGGQRRKLSLAIALLGGSEIIFLDEPSTGIDITTRRQIWEILLHLKGKKTIIISTHFMEEADALSDRIVVLAHGQVQCSGTPIFLKSNYGTGYTLSIVAPSTDKTQSITELVKKYVKGANFKYQNVLTLVYQLPEKESGSFPELFETLDSKKTTKEIVSYNVGVSSMEDVFLNIDSAIKEELAIAKKPATTDPGEESPKKSNLSGVSLLCNHIGALMIKKCIFLKGNIILFLLIFIFLLGISLLMDYGNSLSKKSTTGSLALSLSTYGNPEILYSSETTNDLTESLEKFVRDSGSKIRKVENVKKELSDIYKKDYEKFFNYFIAFEFSKNYLTILYNELSQHGVSIAINVLFNAFLIPKNSSITTSLSFKYYKDPTFYLDDSQNDKVKQCYRFALSISYRFSLAIFPFLLFLIEEKRSNLKTFQLMLVNPALYWLCHFVFDFTIFLIYAVISFVLGAVIYPDLKNYLMDNIGGISLGLVLNITATLLVGYIVTLFSNQLFHAILYIFVFYIIGLIMGLLPSTGLEFLRHVTPMENWKVGLVEMCEEKSGYLKMFIIYILVLFLLLCLVDCRVVPKIWHKIWTVLCCQYKFPQIYPKDETVKTEEELIKDLKKSKKLKEKILVVDKLKRWYCSCSCSCSKCCKDKCTKQAVKDVSFTIDQQECFGLLGVNGAGKSSIFNVVTGKLTPTYGSAYVKGRSVMNCCMRHKTFFQMGFCSQSGSFLMSFNGREMLELIGRLRGLKGSRLKKAVDKSLSETLLEPYQRKKCKTYSGGTLRKLAVAMSIIGDPAMALLDEPTTGIDPAARRAIWDLISGYREKGHSVLLTSHSMDECEALCTRLAIMTTGQFRCVGEITTLKSIFGQNYMVSLKTSPTAKEEDRAKVKEAMMNSFKDGCQVMDEHLTVVQYQITKESATWKKLFSELNAIKAKFPILESFSASSTTLEQLFLHFTKE